MKTIEQWLNELPEPYRKQALTNTSKKRKKTCVGNLETAIGSAFIWKDTPQGTDYWRKLYFNLEEVQNGNN